ncbi:structural protein P5 [Vibrio coralliilyticus]|uniref:structural protein P5 n=1 Tax=Vibrio coralliilyticus TaxID=190893 RepID=UPI00178DC19F|nr:structural protein P5 [Vibrio coralliilyticus]NUW69547.1 structural protein P5 [Vibrio coralliilyticus]
MTTRQPRGFRNHNPLNIEYNEGNDWVGQTGVEPEGRFAQFKAMKYGIRAGASILKRYLLVYHLRTVNQIIHKWAPPSENESDSYAHTVAKRMHVNVDTLLTTADIPNLIEQMVRIESGRSLPRVVIDEGCEMAGIAT